MTKPAARSGPGRKEALVTYETGDGIPQITISFSSMLKNAVVDPDHKPLGRLDDAVVRLRGEQYPLLTGLIVAVGGTPVFVPASDLIRLDADSIQVRHGEWRSHERQDGEVLLKEDVLSHRLVDVDRIALVRAYDVRLASSTKKVWTAIGLDVHKNPWFHLGRHEHHSTRDWHAFLLIGYPGAHKTPTVSSQIRRLKPAHIADIIEGASPEEQDLLLAELHADPELEADVFEELEEDKQARVLKSRDDADIADVLSRMRADDAADAVMELPQDRRQKVLDLLPHLQNTKILMLLGFHEATAGGLMGTDYLALLEHQTIGDALQKLRTAITQQPEALTTIHSLHPDGTLAGTLGLVRALQLDSATPLREAADPDPVFASPDDDIIAVTTRMADFNLLSLPVVDENGFILGIITVDDALEAAIPPDWSRRETDHVTRRLRRRPPDRSGIIQ